MRVRRAHRKGGRTQPDLGGKSSPPRPSSEAYQRLGGHAGEPGRLLAGEALQRVGERQQAGADAPVALAAGEAAQLGRGAGGADRQGCGHGGSSEKKASETPQASDRSVTSSSGRYERPRAGRP